jgi:hypothetical protein
MGAATLIALAAAGYAWAFRCDNQLISEGATRYEVLSKCGPPTFVEQREEERGRNVYRRPSEKDAWGFGGYTVERVLIEEWVYDQGPHRLIYYLRFENGILDRIRTGNFRR